jgi:DNA-binding MarR family transcriptional regulator
VVVNASSETLDDDLAASWELILHGVAATHRRILSKIEHDGVPGQWFEVMRLLLGADEHRMPMSVLARELSMTAGGFTKLADRMAREQLIDRRSSSGDRRVVYAALTAKGLRQAKASIALYHAGLREHVLDVLAAQRLTGLTSAMRMLRDAHEEPHIPGSADKDMLLAERDPALPERRGRGRRSR